MNNRGDVKDTNKVFGTVADISDPSDPLLGGGGVDDGGSGGGGNAFFSIPGTSGISNLSAEEEEDDEAVPLYFGQLENIYNPVDIIMNPEARKQFREVGIASLGVRDSVVAGLMQENKKTQSKLDKLKARAKNIGKPKNKMTQPTMTAARGGLVPSSFPDRLNRIMRYK